MLRAEKSRRRKLEDECFVLNGSLLRICSYDKKATNSVRKNINDGIRFHRVGQQESQCSSSEKKDWLAFGDIIYLVNERANVLRGQSITQRARWKDKLHSQETDYGSVCDTKCHFKIVGARPGRYLTVGFEFSLESVHWTGKPLLLQNSTASKCPFSKKSRQKFLIADPKKLRSFIEKDYVYRFSVVVLKPPSSLSLNPTRSSSVQSSSSSSWIQFSESNQASDSSPVEVASLIENELF